MGAEGEATQRCLLFVQVTTLFLSLQHPVISLKSVGVMFGVCVCVLEICRCEVSEEMLSARHERQYTCSNHTHLSVSQISVTKTSKK